MATENVSTPSPLRYHWLTFLSGDNPALYQALAWHKDGEPDAWTFIRDEVLCKYTHAYLNANHPYHPRALHFENIFGQRVGQLESSAQAVTGPCSSSRSAIQAGHPTLELLEISADALDLEIHFEEHDRVSIFGGGGDLIHLRKAAHPEGSGSYTIAIRCEDVTGAYFLNWLSNRRAIPVGQPGSIASLSMHKVTFAWRSWVENQTRQHNAGEDSVAKSDRDIICANEYAGDTRSVSDLERDLDDLLWPPFIVFHYNFTNKRNNIHEVYTICVGEPKNIRAAVDFVFEALNEAGHQGGSYLSGRDNLTKRRLKPYVAVDCEFQQRALEAEEGMCAEFVSILTIAVDEHLVIMFYILDMLDNPASDTISEITYLMEQTVFNKDLLKIWHNWQQDVIVLETTLHLMFQGSEPNIGCGYTAAPKPPNLYCLFPPKSEFFHGERPASITFPSTPTECEMHGLETCPCEPTLNVELGSVFVLNVTSLDGFEGPERGPWTRNRHRYNWADLIEAFLEGDPMETLFRHCKDACGFRRREKDEFYQSLGPGMETNNAAMAYNIGDVAGIHHMFRGLTKCKDKNVVAMRLSRQEDIVTKSRGSSDQEMQRASASARSNQVLPFQFSQFLDQIVPRPDLGRGYSRCYQARWSVESELENLRVTSQPRLGLNPMGSAGRATGTNTLPTPHFAIRFGYASKVLAPREDHAAPDSDQYARRTSDLTFREHEERTSSARRTIERMAASDAPSSSRTIQTHGADRYPKWSKAENEWHNDAVKEAHVRSFDARNFRMPTVCLHPRSVAPSPLSQLRIIPASVKHVEDMAASIDPSVATIQPPPPPLPQPVQRPKVISPSDVTRSILTHGLTNPDWAKLPRCPVLPGVSPESYLKQSKMREERMVWVARCFEVLQRAEIGLFNERNWADRDGLPGHVDPRNIFDREGREYRRRVEAGPGWLHGSPVFQFLKSDVSQVVDEICDALNDFARAERRMDPTFRFFDVFQKLSSMEAGRLAQSAHPAVRLLCA